MKKLYILIMLVMILLFSACDDSSNSSSNTGIDTSVTFSDIYKAFKSNELAAEEKYDGNRYYITAKINGMETGGLFNLTGGATLTMEETVDDVIVFFLAEFEEDQEDDLMEVEVGDTITFIGECHGGTFSECKIVG